MPTLVGLPGKKADVAAVFVSRSAEVFRALRKGLGATAAGENGAINIWINDEGVCCCQAMHHFKCVDDKKFFERKNVRFWFDAWIKKIK